MTRFLGNWEVESDIILPPEPPFIRHDHPQGLYTAFFRNIPEKRNELTYILMQLIFDAPTIQEAKSVGEVTAKHFLEYLSFASNMKARLRSILHIFNWERDSKQIREAIYFSRSYPNNDAPFEALDNELLDTIALLQTHPLAPRLKRALKWFSTALAARSPDDQFTYFWFVVELVAQLAKEPTAIPDKCPTCKTPLYCPHCEATPLHRPYPKQAIEQLFHKVINDTPAQFYAVAADARNMLLHGEEASAIEAKHKIEFPIFVNHLGQLAWYAIVSQFGPVLSGKRVHFCQTNSFVNYNITGNAHVQIGFVPNFDNPDPTHFPKVEMTLVEGTKSEVPKV
jgi:hypothetical protein